ncbi:methyl-accepting chemotaxis protein [uncultured Vibrio sp.]|uniref:methyl-accepting chemotaxis protein n=1 Tax=uncultured Vibrio sp. TaxID=114054 RepID=UPI0025D40772|nr:methyl-accepting chemotaxis protein [uncultured Vibrio sp.]
MSQWLGQIKLSRLIIGALVFIGVVPALVLGLNAVLLTQTALTERSYNQLDTVRSIKSSQINSFFEEREGDMDVLVDVANTLQLEGFRKLEAINQSQASQVTEYIKQLKLGLRLFADSYATKMVMTEFDRAYQAQGNRISGRQWGSVAENYGKEVDQFQQQFGWYDAFLINTNGDIVYTSTREDDLGKNIRSSNIKGTGLEKAFSRAQASNNKEQVYFGDFTLYHYSDNAPAGFFVTAILNRSNDVVGYAALQFPIDRVNAITSQTQGMGSTGETYLIGSDKLMRSDSRLDPEGHSVEASFKNNTRVETDAAESVFSHGSGANIINDYNGNLVLSVWQPIELDDSNQWAIITEKDVTEAFVPKDEQGTDFYAKYIENYGYYDLFLIDPSGQAFYTVTKEADYQTNFIDGIYASSNLGQLVRDVLRTKDYGIVDFASYAPSNDDPAAFIAKPILNAQGEVIMVVALQLSLDAINAVMQLREGMGESGESYLVGSDFLMRSDSYLNPIDRSVAASFAGNIANNGVRTQASTEAISGVSGSKIITDYNGNQVLSSYAPLDIGGIRWALIAEIDQSEAFASVYKIRNNIVYLMLFTLLVTVSVAIYLAKIIKKPLGGEPRDMMLLAQQVAKGDLTYKFDEKAPADSLYGSLREMSDNLKQLIAQILQASQSLASTAEETSVASEQTTQAVTTQHRETESVASSIEQMTVSIQEVARSTNDVAQTSKFAQDKSEAGQQTLEQGSSALTSLVTDVAATNDDMKTLQLKSNEIGHVLVVIQEIAEQTNLLALNAAIEAARAGNAGRGFAVVADEVRTLAQRTQTSASEIQTMISSVQQAADSASGNMSRCEDQVRMTAELSDQTQQNFVEILEAIHQINRQMEQVSTAAEEQATVTDTVSKSVTTISEMSLQTSASAEQLAGASHEVAQSAEELNAQTLMFKV